MALGDIDNPIRIKQNDTRPKIRATIWQGIDQSVIDLTGTAIVFNMRLSDPPNAVVVSRQATTLVDAANGIVEYTLKASETSTNGLYQGEFETALADGGVLTVPPDYIYIQIGDDIA